LSTRPIRQAGVKVKEMDLVKDACCFDLAEGTRAAILTVLFCGVPLGAIGIWLVRRLARGGVRPPPALHGMARFAIVLLTLNIGLVVLLTAVLTVQLLVEHDSSWYLLAFAAISWFADCFAIHAWLIIWRETHDTRPLSPVR
jgi:hypothetical protein